MLREVIIENCRRLISFFKDNDKYADHWLVKDVSYAGLLKSYGRLLDFYGAPASYMSILFIPTGHYNDFVDYAEKLDNFKVIDFPGRIAIAFDYDGYKWIVENK